MANNNLFLNLNDFLKIEFIGSGSFGKVYKVRKIQTNEIFALKISYQEHDDHKKSKKLYLKREINIMKQLNHPSILKFIGYSPLDFNNKPKPVIVIEYCQNHTLKHILELERQSISPPGWDDTMKLINIFGIASAMFYLHSNKIIHRDLKPENILLNDKLQPKVADFGLSKEMHQNDESMTEQSTKGIKGTPIYLPPESWDNYEFKEPGDVYAFSLIVFELMTLKKPFDGFSQSMLCKKVCFDCYRPEFECEIPQCYKNLIIRCWSQNPDQRPTFEGIVKELKFNEDFIIDTVDKDKYLNYVDFIENNEPHDLVKIDELENEEENENESEKIIEEEDENDVDLNNQQSDFVSLQIKVFEARKLVKVNLMSKPNPFICFSLKNKPNMEPLRTRKLVNTSNPIWNEDLFIYGANVNDILLIDMFSEKSIKNKRMIDQIQVPLSSFNIDCKMVDMSFDLKYKNKNAGTLKLSFEASYAKRGFLNVNALNGRGLKNLELGMNGIPSPYLSFEIENFSCVKTNTIHSNSSPSWNQNFVIEVPDLYKNTLLINLWDNGKKLTKIMNEIEIDLKKLKFGQKTFFDGEIFYRKKSAGFLAYEYELCECNNE